MDHDQPHSIVKLIIVIMVLFGYSLYQYQSTTTTTSVIIKMDKEILETQYNPPNKPFIENWTDVELDNFLSKNSSCQTLQKSLTQKSHYPIAFSLVVHRNASEVIRLITSLYQVWCYITLDYRSLLLWLFCRIYNSAYLTYCITNTINRQIIYFVFMLMQNHNQHTP